MLPTFAEANEHLAKHSAKLGFRAKIHTRINAKLDSSKFFNSTAFRHTERRILKKVVGGVLHPVAALKRPTRWAAEKLHQTKTNTKKSWGAFRKYYSALAAAEGIPKATWITAKQGGKKTATAAGKAGRWVKKNPGKAFMWGPGLLGVMAVVLPVGAVEVAGFSLTGVAPALAAAVTESIAAAGVGASITAVNVPAIIGTGTGGALASGVSSAWAHSLSMINGQDKPNVKRIVQDAGMSAAFGFFGFGVAEGMKSGATALGLGSGLLRKGYDWGGLMAFEMGKDFAQNGVNNLNIKIHKYHQAHADRRWSKVLRALKIKGIEDKDGSAKKWKDIADQTFLMETATNTPRVLNSSWTTNFALKSIIDMGARIVWDRILHGHEDKAKKASNTNKAQISAAKRITH
ncbi:MAG: hypothetical protein JRH20_22900 [Deltaproteobacteria bacterium]|nr:hypothetical protein [Deltaproteobacteria bacterium]